MSIEEGACMYAYLNYLPTPVPAWPGYAHDRISHSSDCYVWPFAEITEKLSAAMIPSPRTSDWQPLCA